MVKEVLPSCNICGIPVADFVEPEIAIEGQIKQGKYVDNIGVCNDCLNKWKELYDLFLCWNYAFLCR